MKMLLSAFIFLSSLNVFAAPARSLEGTYQVAQGCKVDNSRIGVLQLMYFEGTPVTIETDSANGLLLFTAEHNTLALPLTSSSELEHMNFADYYKNSEVRVTENAYAMRTKGSEWSTCDNYPFPGSHPCRRKWDDAVGMSVNAQGQLLIQWKIENSKGTCVLERLK